MMNREILSIAKMFITKFKSLPRLIIACTSEFKLSENYNCVLTLGGKQLDESILHNSFIF